jgi:hypothetical protein
MDAQLQPILPSETQKSSDSLIREWLFRFGIEHKEDVAPRIPLWLEAFGGMDPAILEPLFRKALKSCKFFPKVSEILEPLQAVKRAALPEEASQAWQKVLAMRREHFNLDFPQNLDCAVAELPERVQRAARAAGVFQEVSHPDQLHVWAKKRFIESYLVWEEIEESKVLLPDGELKRLLCNVATKKALPAPVKESARVYPYAPEIAAAREKQAPEQAKLAPEERLAVADALAIEARAVIERYKTERVTVTVSDETRGALRVQGERIRKQYPMSEPPEELRKILTAEELQKYWHSGKESSL